MRWCRQIPKGASRLPNELAAQNNPSPIGLNHDNLTQVGSEFTLDLADRCRRETSRSYGALTRLLDQHRISVKHWYVVVSPNSSLNGKPNAIVVLWRSLSCNCSLCEICFRFYLSHDHISANGPKHDFDAGPKLLVLIAAQHNFRALLHHCTSSTSRVRVPGTGTNAVPNACGRPQA